jgi:tetratricopeptide (TPR) repeat protein
MRKRAAWDFLGAEEDFNALVAYCPEYAEGYNQRAFVSFLQQDFQAALPDLERAIALSPDHVAAMSGRALTLIGLGQAEEGKSALEQALALNPWLPERSLLPGLKAETNSEEEL